MPKNKISKENSRGNSILWVFIAAAVLIAILFLVKFVLFAPKPHIDVKNDTIIVKQKEVNVSWGGKMLGEISCVNNKSLTVAFTNTRNKTLDLGKDVIFFVNDALDKTPLCSISILSPGESTICTGLDAARLGNRPTLLIKAGVEREYNKTSCY